jgi:hypothetical protein
VERNALGSVSDQLAREGRDVQQRVVEIADQQDTVLL